MTASAVAHVGVVVPARNEERLLPGCLDALGAAADAARQRGVAVRLLVVLDRCVDGTAEVAHRAGALTLDAAYGSVGAARAAGADRLLRDWHDLGLDPATAWLAGTDADTLVPADWLTGQLELADAGADAVVGTVEPVGLTEALAAAWHARHRLAEGHPHVHGANLGVRAAAYAAVGGFRPQRLHEDADLVDRLRAAGHRCVATDAIRVATSGRLRSRVEGGFAGYLGLLPAAPLPSATTTV